MLRGERGMVRDMEAGRPANSAPAAIERIVEGASRMAGVPGPFIPLSG